MPNKKGSRLAASQARAKAAAKKRTRSAGPDLSGATKPVPQIETPEDDVDLGEEALAVAAAPSPPQAARVATAPSPYRRAATRRERQAYNVISAGSLRWELSLIGVVTAVCGIALAALKLATDFGR